MCRDGWPDSMNPASPTVSKGTTRTNWGPGEGAQVLTDRRLGGSQIVLHRRSERLNLPVPDGQKVAISV